MTAGRPSPTAALEALALPAIDHIDLVTVKLPFVAPFGTSVHVWTDKEAMLMRIESDGVTAWSKCVADPDPFYAYETNTTARHIIRDFLLPLVEPGITLGELETRFRHVRGHGMAKATVENALLILIAVQRGVPLHDLLGRPAKRIPSVALTELEDRQVTSKSVSEWPMLVRLVARSYSYTLKRRYSTRPAACHRQNMECPAISVLKRTGTLIFLPVCLFKSILCLPPGLPKR